MPQYMLVLGMDPAKRDRPSTDSYEVIMGRYSAWTKMLSDKGAYVESHKLYPGQGKHLQLEGGRVVDGPFIETKETIGGYYIIEAKSIDDAVAMAKGCPIVLHHDGWVDVRPVEI